MRPQKVTVAQAEDYYYSSDAVYKQSESRYLGTGAATLGLEGKSVGEEFSLLIRGYSPSGEKLAQRKNLADDKAIAGTDIPFTLPKSWSLLALVDPELRQAAVESAHRTMLAAEANGWVRGRQTVDGVTTEVQGKMIGAVFPHSTSRENDSHIHAHGVFINMTERPDGTYSTVENFTILQHSKEMRQFFMADFASSEAARKYGQELSIDKGGTVVPEAAGVSKETRDIFSKRHDEIKNADTMRERLLAKMPHLSPDALETLVQQGTKSAKNRDLTETDLIRSHQVQLKTAGLPSLEQMRDNAMALKAVQEQGAERLTAIEYVRQASEDLSEHQSVFGRSELLLAAMKQSIGHVSPAEIDKAIVEASATREIVAYSDDKFTTPEIQYLEGRVATVAVEQRETFTPLLSDSQVRDVVETFQGKKGFTLTRGQTEAVGYALQHTGRIGVIQGDAGAGKSSSMEAVADVINTIGREQGVQVRGFALQGKTSVLLEGDSGISSGTIDSFLNSKSTWDGKSRQLWIVDEYSMADTRRVAGLVERAQKENAQVILLGDKKQLAAIGAGRLGQDLDEHGLVKTVHMDESLRQKTDYAQAIDAAMKQGDVRTALEVMEKAGKLHVLENREERAAAMAKAYVQADAEAREATGGKKGALAMTLTNAERESVIQNIRAIQKEQGGIAVEDHSFTTRAPVALDVVTRKLAASYQTGMIAIPAKQIGELGAGKEVRVTAVDTMANTITLTGPDGKIETIDARKNSKGLMVYEERETQFSVGEKGIFLKSDNTAQGKFNKLKNGVGFEVLDINSQTMTIKTELGNTVQIQGEGAYITNAQAITGHKSQGATEHTGLMSISSGDRLATQNMLYVLSTRSTHDFIAFVDDKEKLIGALTEELKTSSLEEQKELLQGLTEQLKTATGKEAEFVEAVKSASENILDANNKRALDQRRQVEIDNSLPVEGNRQDHQQLQHQESQQQNNQQQGHSAWLL